MCVNCGDFVTMCGQDECHNPNGGLYAKFRKFYVGDTYCRHLQLELGHEKATWEDYEILNKDEE